MKVVNKDSGEVELALDEVFDFKRVEEFRKSYEQIDGSKVKKISINFGQTKYMDSSALGMLLNIQSYFKSFDVKITIVNAKDQIKKILSISRFDQRFEIS